MKWIVLILAFLTGCTIKTSTSMSKAEVKPETPDVSITITKQVPACSCSEEAKEIKDLTDKLYDLRIAFNDSKNWTNSALRIIRDIRKGAYQDENANHINYIVEIAPSYMNDIDKLIGEGDEE